MSVDKPNTTAFSLSQLGSNKKKLQLTQVYITEDMYEWCKVWARYCKEQRGTTETPAGILNQATQSWWTNNRRKIINGDGIKLPDWQCNKRTPGVFTKPVMTYLPREVHTAIKKALQNGHIYANWQKATLTAVIRTAIQQHYAENNKHILYYLKNSSWDVEVRRG